ncbi:hypothetical protein J2Y03_000241 [Neobacillus niacini]|uniref:hypothetical protein n=1 Tax=Neobacillus niacini TaxID=86668 RepID=UPI0028561E67|nr:hypothetical protein [Neobacillus niacini]MDR7075253.1 hypothetical protein [Neobacillus niacini]
MLRIIWRLFFILLCGYLLIEWFPISYPFHFADILVGPIIYPLEFFAASLAFFFGLIVSLQLFQEIFQLTKKIVKKKRSKR